MAANPAWVSITREGAERWKVQYRISADFEFTPRGPLLARAVAGWVGGTIGRAKVNRRTEGDRYK